MPTEHKRTIKLPSDGKDIEVYILGVHELDDEIPIDFDEIFTYRVEVVAGESYNQIFDLSKWATPPDKPDNPESECEPGSVEWYDWKNYHVYNAAVAHREEMLRRQAAYWPKVSKYILAHSFVNPKDKRRIADEIDQNAIVEASLTPRVTKEVLEQVLQQQFPSHLQGYEHYRPSV